MDITYFFKKSSIKDKEHEIENCKKMELKKEYLKLLGVLVNNQWIDILEYTHLVNFIKSGGSLINVQSFGKILEKIMKNNNIKNNIKESFMLICKNNFGHIFDLFGSENLHDVNKSSLCIDEIIDGIKSYEKSINFTQDQLNGIKNICYFLYNPEIKTYGLYGYAGTGKTTLITKLIHYLVLKNFINSVVFAAPTNKAVNIIKSKFRNDIDSLVAQKNITIDKKNKTLMEQLDNLENIGFKIHFLTIHKLLNFKNDFDEYGERIFIKGKKNLIHNYDLVIIDECSMIPLQIILNIFNDIRQSSINNKNSKVLFVGDPAQLPPVNEDSIIFNKQINIKIFENVVKDLIGDNIFVNELNNEKKIKELSKELEKDIINQQSIILKTIVRSDDDNIIGLCNEIRSWVTNKKHKLNFKKYSINNKVLLYKFNQKIEADKTKTKWFQKCIKYFKNIDNMSYANNIILTWTNEQCNLYNDTMRKILFNKKKLNKFEIGDILILNDFYNIKESNMESNDQNNSGRFYTSEQIKITDIENVIKVISPFSDKLSNRNKKTNFIDLENRYKKTVNTINKLSDRKYKSWKLFVHKLTDIMVKNTIPEIYQLYVVKDCDKKKLENDRNMIATHIHDLRKQYNIFHKENINNIDKNIIRPLWRKWNEKFIEPFANVNYGTAMTVHKSQSSTYCNVFVDINNILKMNKLHEMKRCLYTAVTRSANELHLLI